MESNITIFVYNQLTEFHKFCTFRRFRFVFGNNTNAVKSQKLKFFFPIDVE